MNILYVVPYAPNKIRIRPYNLIRFLAARGNNVCLLTLWSNELDQESIRQLELEGIRVYAYPLPAWRSLINSGMGLFSRDPIQSFYCWQPDLARKLEALAIPTHAAEQSALPFDVVHVEHMRGVRFGQHLRSRQLQYQQEGGKRVPIVWDSVDSITHLFKQAKDNRQKLAARLMMLFELTRTGKFEARMAKLFNRTLVTSPIDQEAFGALLSPGTNPVTVIPNGVDLDYFMPVADEQREPATLVISGKMSYHANVSMVSNLIENIMPLIWAKKPDVKLWIVGKDPPQKIREYAAREGVTVTGYVADLRPYLQKATVAVAPLTYGAGIQNKVLEAMACGTPVVTSPKAVSALSAKPGQDLLVEEDPAAFAQQVMALIDQPDFARRIGAAGRHYVESCHHWPAIAAQLEAVYTEVIYQSK